MDQKPTVALIAGIGHVAEKLFHEMLSDQANIITTRFSMPMVSYDTLNTLVDELPKAVSLLQESDPSIITIPITTGSCLRGESLINMLEQQTGVPVLMSAQESVRVFLRLGVRRAAIVSPFGVEINLLEKLFFSKSGIDITHFFSTNENTGGNPKLFGVVDEAAILEQIRTANLKNTDAILFDCPAYDIDPLIETLSDWCKKPAFSILQIMMFQTMERLGLSTEKLVMHRYLYPSR